LPKKGACKAEEDEESQEEEDEDMMEEAAVECEDATEGAKRPRPRL